MAWTYTATTVEDALNWLRLRIGDTDTNDQQLSDEEITSLLLLSSGDRLLAAAAAADAICAKYVRYGAATEAENFRKLAMFIREERGAVYL